MIGLLVVKFKHAAQIGPISIFCILSKVFYNTHLLNLCNEQLQLVVAVQLSYENVCSSLFSFLLFEESGVRITLIIYFGKHNRSYVSTPSLLQFKRWEFKAAKTLGLPERLTYLLSQKLLWVTVHFIRYTENCLKKSVIFLCTIFCAFDEVSVSHKKSLLGNFLRCSVHKTVVVLHLTQSVRTRIFLEEIISTSYKPNSSLQAYSLISTLKR